MECFPRRGSFGKASSQWRSRDPSSFKVNARTYHRRQNNGGWIYWHTHHTNRNCIPRYKPTQLTECWVYTPNPPYPSKVRRNNPLQSARRQAFCRYCSRIRPYQRAGQHHVVSVSVSWNTIRCDSRACGLRIVEATVQNTLRTGSATSSSHADPRYTQSGHPAGLASPRPD